MPDAPPPTVLCLASYFKGSPFLKACKDLGCRVLLLTKESLGEEAWPRESIDEFHLMPDLSKRPDILYGVSYLARTRPIDRIVALDDYDVEVAAALREHLRLPGMGESLARHFRDKLAMRVRARERGLAVPEFAGVFNHDRLRAFMERVPAPWLLKPRSEASAMGIRTLQQADELWPALEALGDQQSFFLLEQYVPGEVFHVDGLVDDGEVLFAVAHQYARPPMNVYQGGGVFITRTMDRAALDARTLVALNQDLMSALGMVRGATHAEFIKAHADGRFYFLETAARVGGANIAEMVEFASGVNLWAEWARIELADLRGEPYQLPEVRQDYAGVINCLARQEQPDLSAYDDAEVVWRMRKKHHAGLIVASASPARVQELLEAYSERFARDFLAVMPPLSSHTEA